MSTLAPNTYSVDYDKRGLIRGMFVIDKSKRPWEMVEYIERLASGKFKGMFLLKLKRAQYTEDLNLSRWTALWVYEGWKENEMKRIITL